MKRSLTFYLFLPLIILLGISGNSNAQGNLCLGLDQTVCLGDPVTIENCGAAPGSGQGISLNNPTVVNLSDDQWSPMVNIGFNFEFYGNNYNQLTIGSNCILSFDPANAGGYCPWNLQGVAPLPNATFTASHNSIMPAYQDINPSVFASPNGSIEYETIGTAPNRIFVVLYKEISSFGCNGDCNYIATILYETSNQVEVHIGEKPLCPGWNGGLAIQGTQNIGGTIAHITPGRNNTVWGANQDGQLWTPDAPNNTLNYAISTVPFSLITSSSTTFQWEDTFGNTYPYNNGILVVNPVFPGVTGYFLSGSACGVGLGAVSDTSFITGVASSVTATGTDDLCSASQGTVTATPVSGVPNYTYDWTTLGNATTQTVTGVPAGTHTVLMTDGNGCTSLANVTIGDTPTNFTGTTTVVSCPGGNDGTATAEMLPALGNITYLWDDPLAQTTATAVGLVAGQYSCTVTSDIGCQDVVVVDVAEIPGMIATIVNQVDPTCNSGSNGIIDIDVTQGTPNYTYVWDNSMSTTNIATDLAVGNHTINITDANGCMVTVTATLTEPAPLQIVSLTPDTQICPEDDIMLTAVAQGGSTTYEYTWYENNVLLPVTGATVTVDPDVTNTQYCVVLSETCGSPTDQKCMNITFPTPIQPSLIPDEIEKCMPGRFEFTNTSINTAEIASSYLEFGEGGAAIEIGADSSNYTYNQVGIFDVTLTTTSIYGCVYSDTMFNLVEVKPNPVADFTFSSNPATVFETTIHMQDRSSSDVIDWQWFSPNSNPSTSFITDPTFYFPEEVGSYPVTLIVETERGCVDTTTLYAHVIQDILFFAPNTFTPDGDEHNQSWKVSTLGIDVYDFDLFIFNRWGELIWENHDPSVGWDGTYNGKPVQSGVYTWRSTVKDLYKDDKKEFNGYINLMR